MAYAEATKVERPEQRGRRKLARMVIEPAENGGHVIEHHFSSPGGMGYHEPKQHVFGPEDGEEALAHIAKHGKFKVGEPEAEEPEEE